MNDEKMAKDYNIEGGSVLHLVSLQYIADRVAAAIQFGYTDPCFASGASIARGQVGAGRGQIFTTYALTCLFCLTHLVSSQLRIAGSIF